MCSNYQLMSLSPEVILLQHIIKIAAMTLELELQRVHTKGLVCSGDSLCLCHIRSVTKPYGR